MKTRQKTGRGRALLTALLALALCAAFAFAVGAVEHTHEGATTLTGAEETLTSGTYIVPEDGLALTKKITIAQENDVTVCLNGQDINSTAQVFEVENGAKLTLCNCGVDGGTITTSYDYAVKNYGYVILEDNVRLSSLTYTFSNSIGATLEMHDTSSLTCKLQNWNGVINSGDFKLYDSAYIETNEDYMIEIADAGATVTDGGHTGESKFTIKIYSTLIEGYLGKPVVYGSTDTAKYSVCNAGYTLIPGTGENADNLVLHAHADTGLCPCGVVAVNANNFPDEVFRTHVSTNFDSDENGILSAEEIAAVTQIYVDNMGISDLTGVEYFTKLKTLWCNDNNLTSLDISTLTELMILYCENNRITELDTRTNYELQYLFCQNNSLVALDLSNNTLLENLDCSAQTITVTVSEAARIDMSTVSPLFDASKVTGIDPEGDYMPNIMLDGNEFIILTYESVPHQYYYYLIGFTKAEDATMDVKVIVDNHHEHSQGANNTCACGAVYQTAFNDRNFILYLADNYFGGTFTNYITPMQVATVTSMTLTGSERYSTSTGDMTDLTGIEHFKNLTSFTLNNASGSITSLNLSALTALETVDVIGSVGLTSLDVSSCLALKSLNASGCTALDSLNSWVCSELRTLDVSGTQLTALNLLYCNCLEVINIDGSLITSLDLSHITTPVALTGATSREISHCGVGYVNMAQFGDISRMTIISGGVLDADGMLKLDTGATTVKYSYATGNGDVAFEVTITLTLHSDHIYIAENFSKDDTHHYTEACAYCYTGVEGSEEEHTYEDGVCKNCPHICTHNDYTSVDENGLCNICTYSLPVNVELGGTSFFYNTFAEALAKAQDGTAATPATITLLKDIINVDSELTFTGGVATLDLNGKTLNLLATNAKRLTLNGATLTIKDSSEAKTGTIYSCAVYVSDYNGILLENASVLTLEGGTVDMNDGYSFAPEGGSTVYHMGGTVTSKVKLNGGTYILEGGTIDVEGYNAFDAISVASNKIYVRSGTISVNDDANIGGLLHFNINYVDEVNISGGTFINKASLPFLVYPCLHTTFNISGGTFENGIGLDVQNFNQRNILPAGYAFIDEAGNPIALTLLGQSQTSLKVTVGVCTHTDDDNDYICEICGEYTFTGAGTEGDPYIVTSVGELITAVNATVNEKNYVKLGADINGGVYTSIDFETTPFELDLNGYRLYVDGAVQIKYDIIGTIKNGILDAHVSTLDATAHLYIDGVTGMGNVCAYNGGCFTITDSSFKAIYISGDNGMVTATNVTITPTSGGIFNISTGMNNNNSTLVLEGVTYTASLADTHWPHTDAQVKLMPNGDGTHNKCWNCCETVIEANVACTDPDSDCTTESTCTCGYVIPAQAAHTLAIKADKNDTHHTLKCTVNGCSHEEDAEHTYKEIIRSDYEVSAATCTQKAVYYKSCDCGHKGTETFEGSLDPNNHTCTSANDAFVPNNDGTHNQVRSCCGAIVGANYSCSVAPTDLNCLTAEACTECGYTPIPAQAQHNYAYNADDNQHRLRCSNDGCTSVSQWEAHVDTDNDNYCNTCNHWINIFEDINISLGEDIKLHFYTGTTGLVNPEIRFTVNGYTKTVKGVLVGNQYKFTFDGVAPHWIGDTVTADLFVDGELKQSTFSSVKHYIVGLKSKSASELGMSEDKYNAMITLVNDLLIYGGAAQTYKEHNTGNLASNNITGSTFTDVTESDTAVQNGKVTFTGATVFFDSVNRLKFKFTASDLSGVTFKLRVNGGEEAEIGYVSNGDGTYTITTGAIYAYCFDDVYTVTSYVGGEADAVLTYSVKSYVFAKQGDAGNIAALVKATYNYGLSAKAYKEFN